MKKKIIIGGIITLATGGLAYLGYIFYKGRKKQKSDGPGMPGIVPLPSPYKPVNLPALPPATGSSVPRSRLIPDSVFPLQRNSVGEKVKVLQKFLNHQHGEKLKVDGIWGNATAKAMQRNGHREQVSQGDYKALVFAMKRLGLAGHEISFLPQHIL